MSETLPASIVVSCNENVSSESNSQEGSSLNETGQRSFNQSVALEDYMSSQVPKIEMYDKTFEEMSLSGEDLGGNLQVSEINKNVRTSTAGKDLKLVIATPAEEPLHECKTCGKVFISSSTLSAHRKTHAEFVCDICGNAFIHDCNLYRHKKIHSSEGPFLCDTCGKSFSTTYNLRRHMKIHTLFACKKCGKVFKTNKRLQKHAAVHQGQASKSFSHLRENTNIPIGDFPCQQCEKRFASLSSLRRHERIHTGKFDHVCEICGKGFHVRYGLERHRLVHSKKKFKCFRCGVSFFTKQEFREHSKIHMAEIRKSQQTDDK